MKYLLVGSALCILVFLIWIWATTSHFDAVETVEALCPNGAPHLSLKKPLKIMTWNIQFLAGKNYIFFYDAIDETGKDSEPSPPDVQYTLTEVIRMIKEENPDVVLLQEVDVGAKRTQYQDQLQLIVDGLAPLFPCSLSTYYWKAGWVPHPKIMGSVGMKLATLSKYKIAQGRRYALGEFPANIISRQFRPKRALLDAILPTAEGEEFHVLNTHLEAYSQGSDLMKKQISFIYHHLDNLKLQSRPWVLGGDFNLLMPGRPFDEMTPSQRTLYKKPSELESLLKKFKVVPTYDDINGSNSAHWYTHFPNDPEVKGPDRTIDYLFYEDLRLTPRFYEVRQKDTLKISDHLPLIAVFEKNNN